ncbi:MAG: hypothetical protein JNL01_12300 [Bdellovibrionales bacterium]|nr:hypothetical protein [Bdellovibrionales bacterium]
MLQIFGWIIAAYTITQVQAQSQVVTTDALLLTLQKKCKKLKMDRVKNPALRAQADSVCENYEDRQAAVWDKIWYAKVKDGNCKASGFDHKKLMNMGDEYVMARADACLANQAYFFYRDKKYVTKTGRRVR